MFSCEELRAELSNLLDGEIPPELRKDIERHLNECSVCRVILDSTSKTLKIVTDHGALEIPTDLAERLTARIMRAVRDPVSD